MKHIDSSNSENMALEMARYRVHKMRRFYTHLFIYSIGLFVYLAKTYFGAPFNFPPLHHVNETFMWIWTFIIAVQGLRLFVREAFLTTDWEQRKIRQYMDKELGNKYE